MEVYMDNSATTRTEDAVVELMDRIYKEDYGNPSSLHKIGYRAEQYVNDALDTFSSILQCKRKNIVFTSGGTESNNTAIIGTALFKESRGKHIITSVTEHPSVLEPVRTLEKRGWEVDLLNVDSEGHVDPDELRSKIRKDTVLVSLMHVNNEIGTITPVPEIGKVIREANPECFFHVDDVQGFGKIGLKMKDSNIDFLSASAHKIHGPKGSGLLYMSDRAAHISPYIMGGGQQGGMRSGTINVPGIAGFAKAAELMYKDLEDNFTRAKDIREHFAAEAERTEGVRANGAKEGSPYILSLTVSGIRAEVLLHALEEKGVYISAGSACSSHKKKVSDTLKGIGLTEDEAGSTVRFSLSVHTDKEEADYCIECLNTVIPELRRFRRR